MERLKNLQVEIGETCKSLHYFVSRNSLQGGVGGITDEEIGISPHKIGFKLSNGTLLFVLVEFDLKEFI